MDWRLDVIQVMAIWVAGYPLGMPLADGSVAGVWESGLLYLASMAPVCRGMRLFHVGE
jgi:hypothetical protein